MQCRGDSRRCTTRRFRSRRRVQERRFPVLAMRLSWALRPSRTRPIHRKDVTTAETSSGHHCPRNSTITPVVIFPFFACVRVPHICKSGGYQAWIYARKPFAYCGRKKSANGRASMRSISTSTRPQRRRPTPRRCYSWRSGPEHQGEIGVVFAIRKERALFRSME